MRLREWSLEVCPQKEVLIWPLELSQWSFSKCLSHSLPTLSLLPDVSWDPPSAHSMPVPSVALTICKSHRSYSNLDFNLQKDTLPCIKSIASNIFWPIQKEGIVCKKASSGKNTKNVTSKIWFLLLRCLFAVSSGAGNCSHMVEYERAISKGHTPPFKPFYQISESHSWGQNSYMSQSAPEGHTFQYCYIKAMTQH